MAESRPVHAVAWLRVGCGNDSRSAYPSTGDEGVSSTN